MHEHFEVPYDHTAEKAEERYRCCGSRNCRGGVRHRGIGAEHCGGPGFRRFRLRFPYRSSGVLLPALSLSLLPAAASALLLPSASRLSAIGLVSTIRRISASGWLRTFNLSRAVDHLYPAAGLDQRTGSILPGIQSDSRHGEGCNRKIRDRLSRCERPVADRQLTADRASSVLFLPDGTASARLTRRT